MKFKKEYFRALSCVRSELFVMLNYNINGKGGYAG
jgi:hypothetical protein